MVKILLIRHAESENNLKLGMPKEIYQTIRNPDPNITDKGRTQTEMLGLHLLMRNYNLKKLYCSAMVRSLETACILQKILKIRVEIKVNIHEVGGIYSSTEVSNGKAKKWIEENYPNMLIPHELTEQGWWFKEAKETKEESKVRAQGLIEEFQSWAANEEADHNDWVGLVTHGAFLDSLLAVLLDRRADSKLKLVHANTGLTAFEFKKDGSYQMLFFNAAEHLHEEVMTLPVKGKEEKANTNVVDNELDEKELPLPRSVSEGYNPIDQVKSGKALLVNRGHNLETVEEEQIRGMYRQTTYFEPEDSEKPKE